MKSLKSFISGGRDPVHSFLGHENLVNVKTIVPNLK